MLTMRSHRGARAARSGRMGCNHPHTRTPRVWLPERSERVTAVTAVAGNAADCLPDVEFVGIIDGMQTVRCAACPAAHCSWGAAAHDTRGR